MGFNSAFKGLKQVFLAKVPSFKVKCTEIMKLLISCIKTSKYDYTRFIFLFPLFTNNKLMFFSATGEMV